MLKFVILFGFLLSFLLIVPDTSAQIRRATPTPIFDPEATITTSPTATPSASLEEELIPFKQIDLTDPDIIKAQEAFVEIFSKRPINEPNIFNITGYTIQYAVRSGVPVNTIILILLLPALATFIVFFRQIIGIPTLEVLVPIALSITLVATGLTIGAIVLTSILVGSIIARVILKRIRIMQLPKMALSTFLVALFVLMALVISASLQLFEVSKLSFLPVLILILLSDKIVALQLARGNIPAIIITFFTLTLGAIGYILLSFTPIRNSVLLYPEIVFLLVPINILMGRYFGLRLTEYHRFKNFRRYVNK